MGTRSASKSIREQGYTPVTTATYGFFCFFRNSAIRALTRRLTRAVGSGSSNRNRIVPLRPHTAKTIISPPGARKIVLGLVVDRDGPRLTRQFRERLELHIFHLEKH